MKVTALIPDDLIRQVNAQAKGDTITECLVIALKEWMSLKKLFALNASTEGKPMDFRFSASKLRSLNRRR